MDRAVQLATAWGAELAALHVIYRRSRWPEYDQGPSWRRAPDDKARIDSNLRVDLSSLQSAKVRIAEGEPGAVIRDVAEEEQSDLVVIGDDRPSTIDRTGRTLDVLFGSASASILVAKQRPRSDYSNILIGTDFTDEALVALESVA